MGKLLNNLNKQIKSNVQVEDAKNCIKIYEHLKAINNGRVWDSNWAPLVSVAFIGQYPYQRIYAPTSLGNTVLKGLKETK